MTLVKRIQRVDDKPDGYTTRLGVSPLSANPFETERGRT